MDIALLLVANCKYNIIIYRTQCNNRHGYCIYIASEM